MPAEITNTLLFQDQAPIGPATSGYAQVTSTVDYLSPPSNYPQQTSEYTLRSDFFNGLTNIEKFEKLYRDLKYMQDELATLRRYFEMHSHDSSGKPVRPLYS